MGIYDDLDNFNLISHGDRREQEWGSLVSQRFPACETLWNRYVVPLTNRIDPKILLIQTFREPLGLTQHAKRLLPLFVCKCYAGAVYGLAEFWRTTTLRTHRRRQCSVPQFNCGDSLQGDVRRRYYKVACLVDNCNS